MPKSLAGSAITTPATNYVNQRENMEIRANNVEEIEVDGFDLKFDPPAEIEYYPPTKPEQEN